jgi:hypothetical protein
MPDAAAVVVPFAPDAAAFAVPLTPAFAALAVRVAPDFACVLVRAADLRAVVAVAFACGAADFSAVRRLDAPPEADLDAAPEAGFDPAPEVDLDAALEPDLDEGFAEDDFAVDEDERFAAGMWAPGRLSVRVRGRLRARVPLPPDSCRSLRGKRSPPSAAGRRSAVLGSSAQSCSATPISHSSSAFCTCRRFSA